MAIAQKQGGGGKQENYDTKTGKFVGTGKWSSTNYDDDNEIISKMDADILNVYNQLNDNEKKEFLNDLYNELISQQTIETMENKFENFNTNEFKQMAKDCENYLKSVGVTQRDFSAFYNEYAGAGNLSFEFNKALRMGFKEFYKKFPKFVNDYNLSENVIIDRAAKMDKLTKNYSIPRDGTVHRFLDENYLIAQFEKFGIFDDYDIFEERMYKYRTIDRKKYSVQQIYDSLQPLIGATVDGDGGFTSFSVVADLTHMGKSHNTLDTYKRVQIKYDMPKGTKCFISNYHKESEGLFPRETKFFIKDIKLEKDKQGLERVVLYYGVQQDF